MENTANKTNRSLNKTSKTERNPSKMMLQKYCESGHVMHKKNISSYPKGDDVVCNKCYNDITPTVMKHEGYYHCELDDEDYHNECAPTNWKSMMKDMF